VRDELVFALESSGVEQFEPQINVDYKGLEKAAEAVHERERTGQAHLSGKIAKVVRAGYQYVLDDKDVKIVRAAQVKLYL
jgi:molecular chaperone GrpE (heat shock protein)